MTIEDIRKLTGKILRFCSTPKSITEITAMLGLKDKKWVRRKYLRCLIGNGLELTIPDKPTSQNQKYRTTQNK